MPGKLLQHSLVCASKAIAAQVNNHVLNTRIGSRPYPQTLDLAGKACQEQRQELIGPIHKLQKNKCCE